MLRKLFQASRGLNSTEINHHFNRATNGREKSRGKITADILQQYCTREMKYS